MRGIAVLLVLVWHAGVPGISAGFVGVDAFFVISGFLITGLLIDEREKKGKLNLLGFYGRRAKRLLPAAGLATAVTVAGTFAFLPETRWSDISGDAIASTLYFENWRLAERTLDYLAQEAAASPFQHYWSLSVEEQFYLVWPLLLLLATPAGTISAGRLGRRVTIAIAIIGIPSLAWALTYSYAEPEQAYFHTGTRVWQFAVGGLVAAGSARLGELRPSLAFLIGWSGVAALVASAFLISAGTAYPGFAALAPTLGTAGVIISGLSLSTGRSVGRTLSWKPLVAVGTISYSLYLWHWPLLIFAEAAVDELTWQLGLGVVIASALPAWLSYQYFENPIRRAPRLALPRAALSVGLTVTVIALVASVGLRMMIPASQVNEDVVAAQLEAIGGSLSDPGQATATSADAGLATSTAQPTAAAPGSAFGAQALLPDPEDSAAAIQQPTAEFITPDPIEATPVGLPNCFHVAADSELEVCRAGLLGGSFSVALIGDSHAHQWSGALAEVAASQGWDLRIMTHASCTYTSLTLYRRGREYTECTAWNEEVRAELLSDPPDLAIITGRNQKLGDGSAVDYSEALADDYASRWVELEAAGVRVVALADTPAASEDLRECVNEHRDDLDSCAFSPRDNGHAIRIAAAIAEVTFWDMNRWICPLEECPAVIGNVLVFRDAGHLSATYALTMAPQLQEELLAILDAGPS